MPGNEWRLVYCSAHNLISIQEASYSPFRLRCCGRLKHITQRQVTHGLRYIMEPITSHSESLMGSIQSRVFWEIVANYTMLGNIHPVVHCGAYNLQWHQHSYSSTPQYICQLIIVHCGLGWFFAGHLLKKNRLP